MNYHHTDLTPVKGKVSIWAIPKGKYDDKDAPLFTYELSTGTVWTQGAVRVVTHDVTLVVPAGINLVAKAIETLEGKRNEAFQDYVEKAKAYDAQISQLKLLSGPSDGGGAIEGAAEVLDSEGF